MRTRLDIARRRAPRPRRDRLTPIRPAYSGGRGRLLLTSSRDFAAGHTRPVAASLPDVFVQL